MTNSFFDTVRVFVLSFINAKKLDLTTEVKKETICHRLSVWDHVKKAATLVVKQLIFY